MENAGIWNFFLLQSLASRARKKMKFFVCLIARFSDHKDGSHHLVLLLILKFFYCISLHSLLVLGAGLLRGGPAA